MTFNKITNYLSLVFAGIIVLSSLIYAYVLIVPIQVLKDWSIDVSQTSYARGETAQMHITYNKVKNARAHTFYYLECARPQGGFVRYPISQVQSNKPKGKGSVTQPVQIPTEVANIPAQCRITISANYTVLKFRNINEEAHTGMFIVR